MLSFLPAPFLGALSFALFAINLVGWASIFFVTAFLRVLVPMRGWRRFWLGIMEGLAECFISGNDVIFWLTQRIEWDVQGVNDLHRQQWYLVTSNHQSWVDIPVIVRTLNRRIPFPRFFLKQELVWVPVVGQVVWAFDMPLMKRYSRQYLEKHPEMRGRDMETTRKACERYRERPVTILNFVEGTRFTHTKHRTQRSPYRYLLLPKAGGIGFVLGAMESTLGAVIDVTIVYPQGRPSFWQLLSGRVRKIIVRVRTLEVPRGLVRGDYIDDPASRARVQEWLADLWVSKDALIHQLLQSDHTSADQRKLRTRTTDRQ